VAEALPTGSYFLISISAQPVAAQVMAAVPKIWDVLKKGVEDGVGKQGPVVQALFQAAFSARSFALSQGRESPLLGLLFKKVSVVQASRLHYRCTRGTSIAPARAVLRAFEASLAAALACPHVCPRAGGLRTGRPCESGGHRWRPHQRRRPELHSRRHALQPRAGSSRSLGRSQRERSTCLARV